MKDRSDMPSAQLRAVERFYELRLEHSRTERAAADERVRRQDELAGQIRQRIEDAQGFTLGRIQGQSGVSADDLQRAGAYQTWQMRELEDQRKRLREAEEAAEHARAEVTRRYQALAAVERLRKRRARDAALEVESAEQKALDEHAIARAAPLRG